MGSTQLRLLPPPIVFFDLRITHVDNVLAAIVAQWDSVCTDRLTIASHPCLHIRQRLPTHPNEVLCGPISKAEYRALPRRRQAGGDDESVPTDRHTECPFDDTAVEPAGRPRVPRPAATADMRRLTVHVAREGKRLQLVTLGTAGHRRVDRIEDA